MPFQHHQWHVRESNPCPSTHCARALATRPRQLLTDKFIIEQLCMIILRTNSIHWCAGVMQQWMSKQKCSELSQGGSIDHLDNNDVNVTLVINRKWITSQALTQSPITNRATKWSAYLAWLANSTPTFSTNMVTTTKTYKYVILI